MEQELVRSEAVLEAIKEASPAEVVRQIFRRDAVEARHPGLEAGVVAVDALDMPSAVAALAMVGGDEEARLHIQFLGDGPVGRIAVGAQYSIGAQCWPQRFGQVSGLGAREYLIEDSSSAALQGYHHSYLLRALAGLELAAALLRGAGQALALSLEGLRKQGFVGLDHPSHTLRLLGIQESQEFVPPPEGLVHREAQALRCLADRQSIRQAGRVLQKFRFGPEPVKGRSCQRGEGLAAPPAPEPLRSVRRTVLDHLCAAAVRAAALLGQSRRHQALHAMPVLPLPKRFRQFLDLPLSQPFQLRNQLFIRGLFHVHPPVEAAIVPEQHLT